MRRLRHLLPATLLGATLGVAHPAGAATFVVSTTDDAGAGSLRQAIDDANAAADADTITFAIATDAVPQIVVATNLPTIVHPVVLDATTQAPAGRVELTGATTTGLAVSGGGTTIRGFVVNGFTGAGISLTGAGGNVVEGNLIGTNVAGTASASPSSATGIAVAGAGGNTIGGLAAAARNLVSGNGTGITLSGHPATANVVIGNWIGTDATGVAPLPNAGAGIESSFASNHTIGGVEPGAGNVISGNGQDGLSFSGDDYLILGNRIGVGADGTTAVPNGRHGIRLFNTAEGSVIGGTAPNHVAHNTSAGVLLASNAGTGNAILGNVIHDNGALGIDIGGAGVNANDTNDVDGGANRVQNFPVLDAAFAGGTAVDGVLDSAADTSFTIELFANDACDPSGHGEGRELVGSLVVATDADGHGAFTAALTRTVGPLELLTATATDPDGNTSEFSPCAPQSVPTTTTTTTSTTSTSTTAGPTTTTSSTVPEPTTTSTSTTAAPTSTSTSSTVPGDSTTTTTTTPDATTTSTTAAGATTTSTTAADPSSTTTSTTAPGGSSTTTSTTAADPSTTTTSTTVAGASTTSTSTTAADPTTTSTTEPGASTTTTSTTAPGGSTTTTSTTDPGASTTTTSTTDPGQPTTTSTTDPGQPSTTSTSTVPGASSTSTTLPPPPTSSTTLPAPTTTTTAAPPTTTTTTSAPASTTSSTSTTVPAPSTTLPPGSSTSTTQATTSSTSTSVAAATTTTSSTLAPGATTTTTLPGGGCAPGLTFDALACRLAALDAALAAPDLAPVRPRVERRLGKAQAMIARADDRCALGKRGPTRKSLRLARQRLHLVGTALRSRGVRKLVPAAALDPLGSAVDALASDLRTFAGVVACR